MSWNQFHPQDDEEKKKTPPAQDKLKDAGWYSWPVVIICFVLGLFPIGIALAVINLLSTWNGKDETGRQRHMDAERQREMERTVKRAMDTAATRMPSSGRKSAAQESMDKVRAAYSGQKGIVTQESIDKARAAHEQEAARKEEAVRESVRRFTEATQNVPPAAQKKKHNRKVKKQKLPGMTLRILGIIFLSIGGIIGMSFLADLLQGYYVDFDDFFSSLGFLVSGGIMMGRGQYLAHMTRRSDRYLNAIGDVDAMPLSEIAKRVNRSQEKTIKELQKLIDKGYLGQDAYIDRERGYFLRFGVTVAESSPVKQEAAPPPPPVEVEEGYSGILRNIRRANDRIADEELSRKIDRIEQVSALIFKEVEKHPEKRARIRTFFDYYLPTTQKLLDAYAEFEETGVEGEHLRVAKTRIEESMDAIVEGFEYQLDQLYSADVMDVVSDIQVMESMLQRDTNTAAKDFGYPVEDTENGGGSSDSGSDGEPFQLSL